MLSEIFSFAILCLGKTWPKKESSMEKRPTTKVENFLKSIFDLNKTCEIGLTESLELLRNWLLYIFIEDWKASVIEKSKNWSFEKTGTSYEQKFVCSDNSGQNIWSKVRKSSKMEQDWKSLVPTFAYFLTASAKFYFRKGDWVRDYILKPCNFPKYYDQDCEFL